MSAPSILAAFDRPDPLLEAVREMRRRGCRRMDAFSPYPVEELAEALDMRQTRLPLVMLVGAIVGAGAVYALMLYSVLIDYPINVGGRPLHAWPAFLVITFEAGVLGAALAGFVGLMRACGLPRYHHPVFDARNFTYAHGGRFYLLIEGDDPALDPGEARRALEDLGAATIEELGA